MLTCLDNVEETLVPVPGSHVGSFMSSQDANNRFPPIALLPGVLERVRRDRVLLLFIARDGRPILVPSRGGKSTKILYSSKSTITLLKFYLSTSKSTSLKIYSSKSKK